MDSKRVKFLLRGAKQKLPQHKQTIEHLWVRKKTILRIMTEAYNMGREDEYELQNAPDV
jgi:hypothetical protein